MNTEADFILARVYKKLKIERESEYRKYKKINEVVEELQKINRKRKINGKTTGTISERLCELALKASVPSIYKRISDKWNWMADFSVLGHPFNLLISVKSFKAKERLLVSGSGNILSPTIGWGLMNDPGEWTEARTRVYLFRSFIAIYIPAKLFTEIDDKAKKIRNINGKPFLRKADRLIIDLKSSIDNSVIDISSF